MCDGGCGDQGDRERRLVHELEGLRLLIAGNPDKAHAVALWQAKADGLAAELAGLRRAPPHAEARAGLAAGTGQAGPVSC